MTRNDGLTLIPVTGKKVAAVLLEWSPASSRAYYHEKQGCWYWITEQGIWRAPAWHADMPGSRSWWQGSRDDLGVDYDNACLVEDYDYTAEERRELAEWLLEQRRCICGDEDDEDDE